MEKLTLLQDSIDFKISSYLRAVQQSKSPYFLQIDVFNLKPTETLTILSNFKTYQQTTEYTCGPATALMVLNHFGENSYDELQIAQIMGCSMGLGDDGTSTDKMVDFFKIIDWDVNSSLTKGNLDDGYTFDDPTEFKDWVIDNLKNNIPIMVEWIDWGGHWHVIIGYDTMGTDSIADDVIIFADSYDTTDHVQDGYYIFSAHRFFYMWFDKDILPKEQSSQPWVIAKPKTIV
jgi:Peptidase_C39 like family